MTCPVPLPAPAFAALFWRKATSAGVIAAVTFVICTAGLALGKRFGTRLAGRANLLGGGILIAIGLEIFFSGVLG